MVKTLDRLRHVAAVSAISVYLSSSVLRHCHRRVFSQDVYSDALAHVPMYCLTMLTTEARSKSISLGRHKGLLCLKLQAVRTDCTQSGLGSIAAASQPVLCTCAMLSIHAPP